MLRIALAQINTTVGDFNHNIKKITEYIMQARKMSVDVVVFPEMAVTGYPPEDLLYKKHFIQDNLAALHSIAGQTKNIAAVIGFVDADSKGNLFNAAAVFYNGKVSGIYHKAELPNYGVFDEKRYFVPGTNNSVFLLGKIKFGISICEDIWTKNGPCYAQARSGAKVLINISSSPYHAGKGKEREKMLKEQAVFNKAFVCYANLVGGQDELVFDGGSCIVDPKGKFLAAGKQFEEDLVVADLEVPAAVKVSKNAKVKNIVIDKIYSRPSRLPIKGRITKKMGRIEEIYQALVLGTRDYVQKNGFKKVVIGLSGGIDSSLVAAVACDALGNKNVIGVTMPSKFTSRETRKDAHILADRLGMRVLEIPIGPIHTVYLQALHNEFKNTKPDTTEENIQARIRGNILMAFSNKFGWLVLTTGNKSEVAVGYCTLYGDMAGGFCVLKDVPKTVVYELSDFLNAREGRQVIPQSVIDRAPSAELRENQKDEDSLPPYKVLDPVLKEYVELDYSLSALNKKWSHPFLLKITEMIDKNEYKRRQAPPGIKLTPKAFGRDRRFPITNRYKER